MQIVAPAGSYSGLVASINAGADAVYLGMREFGARAKAENFDCAALRSAVELAHLYGVKVFVALNTLIKDSEMSRAVEAARLAHSVGVDAAIVQDIRYIKELKRALPDFALHASTQMGVHNADGAKVLRDLGISRAVLARETLPSDISEIKKTGIEIEFFVQGALCVCFSGNCYFSSMASSYSGNRGKCMQLCRKPYHFHDERGYYLSAKDLCMYDRLDMLEDLGVDAIKIEGRMRSDEYAFAAVKAYKSRPVDAVNSLKSAFNRGDYCDGYLSDGASFNVVYPKIQGNMGILVGKIDAVNGNTVKVKGFIPHKNDGFKILRGGTEVCGAAVHADKIVADGLCKCGDELRKTFSGELSDRVKSAKRLIDISVNVDIKCGEVPKATVIYNNFKKLSVCGDIAVERAVTHSVTRSEVERAFTKVSEYPFKPDISVNIEGAAFIPISVLNEFRRKVYRMVKEAILNEYTIKRVDIPFKKFNYNKFDGHGKILMVDNADALDADILAKVDYIVLNPSDYSDIYIPDISKPILLNLPITMRGTDKKIIETAISRTEIFGVVSNNIYSLGLTSKPILLGTGHNIIGEFDAPHVTSFEADRFDSGFRYVFGYVPLMTLCHCPYGKCVNCSGNDELIDDSGRKFKLRRYKASQCYWQLLNCVPTYLDDNNSGDLFFDGTACSRAEIRAALDFDYRGKFTRGNTNKGLK